AGWRFQLGATHLGPFPVPPVTPGTFTGFIAALLMGGQSLRQLANLQTVMSEGLIAARRLFATLDVQPQLPDQGNAKPLPGARPPGSRGGWRTPPSRTQARAETRRRGWRT